MRNYFNEVELIKDGFRNTKPRASQRPFGHSYPFRGTAHNKTAEREVQYLL